MQQKQTCQFCGCLIKNYLGTNRTKFNACCGKFFITYPKGTRPRIIQANIEDSANIATPSWCPKIMGVTSRTIASQDLIDEVDETFEAATTRPTTQTNTVKTTMTYTEKREQMLSLPRKLEWEDIKEGEYYVIPQIQYQAPKLVKVALKTETLIRCNEVKSDGSISAATNFIYPKDIDMVFITKYHKF